jgi:hypothetical protein
MGVTFDQLTSLFPRFESRAGDRVSRCRLYIHLEKGFREGSVVIATRYGLDGLGIESQCERSFPQTSKKTLGPTQPPAQWVPDLFAGGKETGAWR